MPTDSLRIGNIAIEELPERIGVAKDVQRLKEFLSTWSESSNAEVSDAVRWQMQGRSKYFRPLTIFACHYAIDGRPVSKRLLHATAALEIFHNVSLIVDDILDRSRERRGKPTLHCRFGFLKGLMVSGYLTAGGFKLVQTDGYSVELLGELMQRLGVAECLQWRLRRHPLGVEDWRMIAGEDTGSMFEICARLGTRDNRLQQFGKLLGLLYHGCDDVGDVRGAIALGGGGEEDIRDGILTLPAALAIRDPKVALLFRSSDKTRNPKLAREMYAVLPEAEDYLDRIAEDAEREARRNAKNPSGLIALINHTRALSKS